MLEDPKHFPGLAGIRRKVDGGDDEVMYLEGSDQHRGWFQSSLLESCGTRGRAPFDVVLTHGFTLDEKGRKQSKSLGNQTFPQDIIKASGADILRLWVASADYTDDQRIGPEILKMVSDNYRKLRNTLRWMLGTLAHYDRNRTARVLDDPAARPADAASARRTRRGGAQRPTPSSTSRASSRRCRRSSTPTSPRSISTSARTRSIASRASSLKRLGALEAIERIFRAVTVWLAPILVFTAEEAWGARYPGGGSVHLEQFPEIAGELPRPRARGAMGDAPQAALGRHRRARDRPRRQGDRLLAGGAPDRSISRTRPGARRWTASISPRSASSRT